MTRIQARRVADAWVNGREAVASSGRDNFWTDGVAVFLRGRPVLIRDLDPDFVLLRLPEKVSVFTHGRLASFFGNAAGVYNGGGMRVRWSGADMANARVPLTGGTYRLDAGTVYRMSAHLLAEPFRTLNPYVRKHHWAWMSTDRFLADFQYCGRRVEAGAFDDSERRAEPLLSPKREGWLRCGFVAAFSHRRGVQVGRWLNPILYTFNRAVLADVYARQCVVTLFDDPEFQPRVRDAFPLIRRPTKQSNPGLHGRAPDKHPAELINQWREDHGRVPWVF